MTVLLLVPATPPQNFRHNNRQSNIPPSGLALFLEYVLRVDKSGISSTNIY